MCGTSVVWDLMVLDFAFMLVLLGGSLVLRARQATPLTWAAFGTMSILIGMGLFSATYHVQAAEAEITATMTATALSMC